MSPALTPYPDVNEILNLLHSKVQEVLREQFVGMYLYGSLSSGDFHPQDSDIDFLVVTRDAIPNHVISHLEQMHNELWKTNAHWASKLEGSYIPQKPLRRYESNGEAYPTVNESKFYVAPHGSDWVIQRHIIREYGKTLKGPDPKSLIDAVSVEEIKQAVMGTRNEWWFPMLADPSWLGQYDSHYHSYAILTMCRALHTLETGRIISKPAAARWAQVQFGEEWSDVIEQALKQRVDAGQYELYESAIQFIGFTKEHIQKI